MLTHDVNDLMKQRHELRLQQADTIKNLAKINKAETNILKKIEEAKACQFEGNTFVEGDILRINNRLRDEYGRAGVVTRVRKT